VTFDDAYRSILGAVPVLEELKVPATVFACSALAETGAPLRVPELEDRSAGYLDEVRTLDWKALGRLAENSIEIGSHTVSHPHLTRLSDDQLARELEETRQRIAEALGRPCRYPAYPYGEHDLRVRAAARSAGYAAAFSLVHTGSPLAEYALPRVDLYRKDGIGRLALKTSCLPVRGAVARLRGGRQR
jgi:peptidoglycan/xylan/chitin deacetylase (PgdA/CDA1 family)